MSELTPLSLDDYEAIADAVQETERGRWFLSEFARRNRAADTEAVLAALAGIERRIAGGERSADAALREIGEALRVARLTRADPTARTDDRFAELEGTLVRALVALGAVPPPPAERAHVAPPSVRSDQPAPPLAIAPPMGPEVPVETTTVHVPARPVVEAEMSAAQRPQPGAAQTPPPEKARLFSVSPYDARTPDDEPVEASARPHPPARRPGLLESLSEAEKAILFA